MSPRRVVVVTILGALAWACRDAPSAWEPPDAGDLPTGARQLTFNVGDDRSPAWSADGESIIYVAEGFGDLARSEGVLVSIPRGGGSTATVFPLVQPQHSPAPAILLPALDTTLHRVAYVQLLSTGGSVCSGEATSCDAAGELDDPPSLGEARIRVRAIGAGTPSDEDPTLELDFDGVEFDSSRHPFDLPGVWVTRLHPFQRRFNEVGSLPARPAWDPLARRLVTSDGLRLLLWTPGTPAGTPIDGTEEGSSPAWSPDGSRIAFTRLDRGPELQITCEHIATGTAGQFVACVEERTQWPIARSMIVLVRPEGGPGDDLIEGMEPAWSPDGVWIFFSRSDGIWRIRVAGGSAERVPGTDGAVQPAVSPDGTELAFTLRDAAGKGDIWVVPLTP